MATPALPDFYESLEDTETVEEKIQRALCFALGISGTPKLTPEHFKIIQKHRAILETIRPDNEEQKQSIKDANQIFTEALEKHAIGG